VPVLDEAVLLVSELCTNALLHTASGDNGTFEVIVRPGASSVRVEVRDDGSDRTPAPSQPDASAEDGRGLRLVELIADQWGQVGDWRGRSIFFELQWKKSD
jgi:two-component sensor histidine kinase